MVIPMIVFEKNVASTFQAVHEAVEEIMSFLKSQWPWLDKSILFKINFLLRELMNNAVEHGNKFSENKKVLCRILKENQFLVLEVTDEGDGIVLLDQSFPTDDAESLLRERNRGYQLLLEMALDVSVAGNQVKVILDLHPEQEIRME